MTCSLACSLAYSLARRFHHASIRLQCSLEQLEGQTDVLKGPAPCLFTVCLAPALLLLVSSDGLGCEWSRRHTQVHRWSRLGTHVLRSRCTLRRIFVVSTCTHHVISQPRPSPFLRRYHLPHKSKRARNGEGLGPRLIRPSAELPW